METKQVNNKHYKFDKYANVERFSSYYYQIKEILSFRPKNILEIGVGDKVVGHYIKNNYTIDYKSIDIAEDLKPDVVGSVTKLPFPDSSFDVVCAFEVLEHLEFCKFEPALREMLRVSKDGIIISLPHFGPPILFVLKIPFIKKIKISIKISWPIYHRFNGEHYWELGKNKYPVKKIVDIISRNAKLRNHYVPFENQYHHFFIIKKN